jgi:predicted RNase H-like nuclease (RuvC/YqgF family)
MEKSFKKVCIYILIVLVVIASVFFTGYGIGYHRSDKQWTDNYNQFRIDAEAELSGARDSITELTGTVERYGSLTDRLRAENNELRTEVGELKVELGNLKLELDKLRSIESATRDVYRKLGIILESDRELIDKIIDVARTLQSAIVGVEESDN